MSAGSTAYTELQKSMHANSARALVENLTRKEIAGYSIGRAVRALLSQDRSLAGFEYAVSEEITRQSGRPGSTVNSLFVPTEILAKRDLTSGIASAGGNLVETELGPLIPALRARSVIARLGATVLPNLVGNLALPKYAAGASTNWLSTESSPATESTPLLSLVVLTPKTVVGFVEVSRNLLQQQSAADLIIGSDLIGGLAAAVDSAGINGNGASGQPLGLLNTVGVNAVTGTALAWPTVLDFVVNSGAAHLDLSGWAMPAAIWKLLANRERFTGGGRAILNDGTIDGLPAIHSATVPAATLIAGPWPEIVVGTWGDVELTSDAYSKFTTALVSIRAIYTVDVGVRYPASFSAATSIT